MGSNNNNGQRTVSLEEMRQLREQVQAEAILKQEELDSLDRQMAQERTVELEGPKLVKTFQTGFNRNGFVDALVLGFLTAVAGLTSFLYMLFNINGIMY